MDLRFVYDGWNLVQEIDALVEVESGVTDVVREYTWGLDLSGQSGNPSPAGIHGAGGIGGLLGTHWTLNTTSTSDDKAYIYFYDANGNVGQMIDVVSGSSGYGTIAAKYEYYPFGGLLVADGVAAEANPFRFSTKYRDNETGCYYYGYRYLRTKHGRWLSRDPLKETWNLNEWNSYASVLNSPIDSFDVLGLQTASTQPTPRPAGGGRKIPGTEGRHQNCIGKSCSIDEWVNWPGLLERPCTGDKWQKAMDFVPKGCKAISCDQAAGNSCCCDDNIKKAGGTPRGIMVFLFRWIDDYEKLEPGVYGPPAPIYRCDIHMLGIDPCKKEGWFTKQDKEEEWTGIDDPVKHFQHDSYPRHNREKTATIGQKCFCCDSKKITWNKTTSELE